MENVNEFIENVEFLHNARLELKQLLAGKKDFVLIKNDCLSADYVICYYDHTTEKDFRNGNIPMVAIQLTVSSDDCPEPVAGLTQYLERKSSNLEIILDYIVKFYQTGLKQLGYYEPDLDEPDLD